MRSQSASPPLRAEVVESLRVLFDILDTQRVGAVSYDKLSSEFSLHPPPHLPPHFLACAARVTNENGFLDFDRFLAAVRLSLRQRRSVKEAPSNLHRFHSEGRINQIGTGGSFNNRRGNTPVMGVGGFDRRSAYGSHPAVNTYEERFVGGPLDAPRRGLGSTGSSQQVSPQGSTGSSSADSQPLSHSSHGSSNGPRTRPPPPDYENFTQVIMRKKPSTVRSQKEESNNRARNQLLGTGAVRSSSGVRGSRPMSTNSYSSLASSGMENLSWRHSVLSHSPPHNDGGGGARRSAAIDDESAPRVAKLERLHGEEEEVIKRGLEKAHKLIDWYKDRLETIEKRQRLLHKGVVALDPSVPEQRLNFLRAHVTKLNRKATALMESSEKGFPTHANLSSRSTPAAVVVSAGSSKSASPSSEGRVEVLEQQNRILSQELIEKTRAIEQLKRESVQLPSNNNSTSYHHPQVTRIQPMRPTPVVSVASHRPSAFVRPAVYAAPIKVYDTLM